MKTGVTTFVFRYLLMDPSRGHPLSEILDSANRLKVSRLQVCENASPLDLTLEAWDAFLEKAKSLGIEIHLGCKTLNPKVLESYLARASRIPSKTLRVVLEEEGESPTGDRVSTFLRQSVDLAEKYQMRLAIENHFDIATKRLAEWVQPFPPEIVGFCLDSANSLRRFEPVENVFESLGSRAYCFHLKDFKVTGSNVGFTVEGAPLGKGDLDLKWVLEAIRSIDVDPEIYLETWVASTGVPERDVACEWEWLAESLETLQDRLRLAVVP